MTADQHTPAYLALGAALLLFPAVASDFFPTQTGGYSLIYGMLGLSLMILPGYGGMVSLAQITVAGVAAYVIAISGENTTGVLGFGWVWWIVTPLAITIAAITSALIGWIAVRTEGIYTIMITLAVATAITYFTQQNVELFNGHSGFAGLDAPVVRGGSTGAMRCRASRAQTGRTGRRDSSGWPVVR